MEKIQEYDCDYLLIDSPAGKYRGGNGTTFDWSLLKNGITKQKKIILAGGLTSENVKEAIQIVGPYMVDVSSGVETNGKKDVIKIRQFIETVKLAALEEIK